MVAGGWIAAARSARSERWSLALTASYGAFAGGSSRRAGMVAAIASSWPMTAGAWSVPPTPRGWIAGPIETV